MPFRVRHHLGTHLAALSEVICDLTGYRKGQVGFRWRTQSEVLNGRGQFSCANKFPGACRGDVGAMLVLVVPRFRLEIE
jgi:hypothetical protein